MTNKERAEKVFNSLTYRQESIAIIERALDEAENFGLKIGMRNGQMLMRERAKMLAKNIGDSGIAEKIGTLPIEGE